MYIPEPALLLIGESLALLALVVRDRRRGPEEPPPAIVPPVLVD